ncbi:hypothetical protein [Hymenobacter weizhouensis]|uniref:hypothetical protein n=1 Tax=Hymenobacter sp. YIM 151500-1 TaxID=2987689 RepID=UPI0022266129|nr:hypothetical protein [Hymenobacter sp. YIM 151500-1]UYZ63492.1 hypothetical protein OIS53_01305 [Hymenobacter sp. YIM 151500-1]
MHALNRFLAVGALLAAALLGRPRAVHAQGGQHVLFLGSELGVGVGRYNGIGLLTGPDIRYQLPLGRQFALTARTGLDVFFVKGRYSEYYRYYYGPTTGLSIPVTVGPRFYIVEGLHTSLNLGVDIGVNRLTTTSFHFEPGVGYALPVGKGNYVDLGTSFGTSFSQGSGVFLFTFAYGLNLNR